MGADSVIRVAQGGTLGSTSGSAFAASSRDSALLWLRRSSDAPPQATRIIESRRSRFQNCVRG
jgi:hypothetical protein